MRAVGSRILALFHRRRLEAALNEEVQSHLDLLAADYERTGMTPAEAQLAARRAFGGVEQMKERYRDRRGVRWLNDLQRDLHFAARGLARHPGFTLVAVLTLALGIGASTAVFSIVEALMLRQLPVKDPKQLVQLARTFDGRPAWYFPYPIVLELQRRHDLFSGVFGVNMFRYAVGEPGTSERAPVAAVTGGYYQTLGLTPSVGRLIQPQDDRPGSPAVAVLSEQYWRRHYAGDRSIVGRSIRIEGVPVTIVGVGPPGFDGVVVGRAADLTIPVAAIPQIRPSMDSMLSPQASAWNIFLRLDPAVPEAGLHARLTAAWRQAVEVTLSPSSRRDRIAANRVEIVAAGTGWTSLRETYARPLTVLLALVAAVLLVACANVANLVLARTSARHQELATRAALGSGRSRLMRQLMTESLMLSAAGSVAAIGIAAWGSQVLVGVIQRGEVFPFVLDVSVNWRVLSFAGGLAVVTSLLSGCVPAWRAVSRTLRAAGDGRRLHTRGRVGSVLVTAQVGLSVFLLIGGGLFVRTLQNLHGIDAGFTRDSVMVFELEPPDTGTPAADPNAFFERVRQAVAQAPGVRAVSFAGVTPLSGGGLRLPVDVRGAPPSTDEVHVNLVAPGYFDVLRTGVRAGRDVTDADRAGAAPIAIVNEAFARQFLTGEPLAASIVLRDGGRIDRRVVGVVADAVYMDLREPPPPTVYVPFAQLPEAGFNEVAFVVSLPGTVAALNTATALRRATAPFAGGAPLELQSLSDQVERTLVRERLMALLAGSFAFMALALAAIGLYGLLSYTVTQRTGEFGVRAALGARSADVAWLVVRDTAAMVLGGLALGLPLAYASSGVVRAMLFGLEPTDPFTVATAIVVLILSAAVAAYLPARRAARVDPLVALRSE